MRILLDESLPSELKDALAPHSARTVQECGWSGTRNGELLRRAAAQFDLFLTADQNLQYQQNLQTLPIAVVVVTAQSNRIQDLRPLVPKLLSALGSITERTLMRISS
jgi:predicted nuclease of predicted toxin-antitoxin system